ncbi:MAG: hypothetical protein RL722_922 [Pseudomonadota bacterium]
MFQPVPRPLLHPPPASARLPHHLTHAVCAGLLALAGTMAPGPGSAQPVGPVQGHTAKAPARPHGQPGTAVLPAAEGRDPYAVADPAAPFAVVDGTVIRAGEFQRALQVAARQRYYHAKPPAAELETLRREVGQQLIDRVLLLAEARRLGITPDAEQIQREIAGYDARYAGSASWQGNRGRMLAAVQPQLEDESRLARLGARVRQVAPPDAAQLGAWYEAHRDLFVEPEQLKLSVILLRVEPSSPQSVWEAAHEEARAIHRRLVKGADFAELARLHSGDRSAASGGALEYTHRGMLPEAVHTLVDALQPGSLGEPVQLLEGVAILRLDGRRPALQRRQDEVAARLAELYQRDTAEAQWQAYTAALRRQARIQIDESHYGAWQSSPRGDGSGASGG